MEKKEKGRKPKKGFGQSRFCKGDLLQGAFLCAVPRRVICTDITDLPITVESIPGKVVSLLAFVDIATGQTIYWEVATAFTSYSVIKAIESILDAYLTDDHGMILHSDRGGQFASEEVQEFMRKFSNCVWSMSPGYTPKRNGVVERHFHTLKNQGKNIWPKVLSTKSATLPSKFANMEELRATLKAFYKEFHSSHRQSRRRSMTPNAMEEALLLANKVFPRENKLEVAYRKGRTPRQQAQALEMTKYIDEAIRAWQLQKTSSAAGSGNATAPAAHPPAGIVLDASVDGSPAPVSLIPLSEVANLQPGAMVQGAQTLSRTGPPGEGITPETAAALTAFAEGLRIVSANQVRLAEAIGEVRGEVIEGRVELSGALATVSQKLDSVTQKLEELERQYKPRKRKRFIKNIPRTPFTTEMMEACVHLAENYELNVVHTRNCLAILTAASTGCRINEIRTLTHAELTHLIDYEYIEIKSSKQKAMLTKAIPERHADMLQIVFERLKQAYRLAGIRMEADDYVFVSSRTLKPMAETVFIKEINRFLKIVKEKNEDVFEGYLRSHSARIGFATRLLRATDNLALVKDALGHADIRSTSKYVRVTGGEIKEALENAAESKKFK